MGIVAFDPLPRWRRWVAVLAVGLAHFLDVWRLRLLNFSFEVQTYDDGDPLHWPDVVVEIEDA